MKWKSEWKRCRSPLFLFTLFPPVLLALRPLTLTHRRAAGHSESGFLVTVREFMGISWLQITKTEYFFKMPEAFSGGEKNKKAPKERETKCALYFMKLYSIPLCNSRVSKWLLAAPNIQKDTFKITRRCCMLCTEARDQHQQCLPEAEFTEAQFSGDSQNCVIKLKFCFTVSDNIYIILRINI